MRFVGGVSVDVARPVRGPAVLAVYATGTVEATVMMPIAPRMAAKLAERNVDEGSQVVKGQVLARLDDADMQNNLLQFKAREALAKTLHDRKAVLVKNGGTSKEDFEVSKAEWEAAKALTAKAQAELNFTKLIAPEDGTIIKRDGEIGQHIQAGQAVFWMMCCAPLRISVEVNEEDIAGVKPGQEVLIRADAFPDKVFNGKVQSITPKGDPVARTYRVRVSFSEPVPLQIGMTAETNIIISKKENALLVPSSAVAGNKLWLVRDGKLVQQEITTGAKGLNQIEVIAGIKEDEAIIVHPSVALKAGQSARTRFVEP